MNALFLSLLAFVGAATWLVLLEATSFNALTLGIGLLVVLGVVSRERHATR